MGQNNARQRLEVIRENVDEITDKIKADELNDEDRNRSHEILLDYIKELKFMLSKSLRPSRIRKVEKLIVSALQELAALEGSLRNVEPRLKAKSMQTLHEIEKDIKMLNASLTNQNLQNEKETVSKYKKRISLIEDFDNEIGETKNKVLDVVSRVENTFTELDIEEQLRRAEEKHFNNKLELSRFVGVSESKCYQNHKEHLLNLKEEVSQILEVSPRISERKSYLLYNINNNIAALDKKAKENEDNIKKLAVEEEVFRATTPVMTNHSLIEDVINSYTEFEKSFSANCTLDELQDVFRRLGELKVKIDQKLKVLENQIQVQDVDADVELVPVKENDFTFRVIRDLNEEPVAPPRVVHKINNIQKAVDGLQEQITRSKYTKDSHTYQKWKKELEAYKAELEILPIKNEEDRNLFESVTNYVDDVLAFLESHYTDRRSTTGDLLIDIMSASTTVNDLGHRIQNTNAAEDYDFIEHELLELFYYLKKLEVPPSRSNVSKFRDYVVVQIDSYLTKLEKMKKNVRTPTIVESLVEQIENLD